MEEISIEETRNWLELPQDVMSQIFLKLDMVEILHSVQNVCTLWRIISKDPLLYRSIDLRNQWDVFDSDENDMERMSKEGVERSCGQLVEFSMEHFGTEELLHFMANRSTNLRCLRLAYCYHISDEALMAVTKQLPLLEEVELCHCSFSPAALETFGRFCPHLKSFRVDHQGIRCPLLDCDDEAFAIAKSMPQLRHLHLFGNKMTDNGLRAILDGCPHLESLDLRQCFSVYMGGDLEKKCKDRIKKLKLPNGPTEDYEFVAELDDFESFDADYPSGVSEIDFISEDEYIEFSESSYFSDMDDFHF
ncbi:hypothetical protein Sjap_026303 [Stephania japonica]|uniref:F-box domain-containing protein n=1 Tax=Stephania japonica TaxID=461633 RepID=A0AAP0E7Q7_9MAGN